MDYELPKRIQLSNKGTYGKVVNVAGSKYMRGAAYLSSIAALKSGCGYAQLVSCDEVVDTVSAITPEIIFSPIEELSKVLNTADVITIGCGLSTTPEAVEIFKTTLKNTIETPIIIDADGLNILSSLNIELPSKLIITPHPKEAGKLLNKDVKNILDNTEKYAKELTQKYKCITVLKTHETIVCSQDGKIYKNTTGNSCLAKAGSGDVLTGIIAGLIAQKMNIYEASCLGVYLHGLTGDIAKNDLTEYGVLASDLIRYIPCAFKYLIKD